ncbi:hypothetical protein [Labrenzia sp. CP4]|jgi:hypothetical protein|uniref:hypothetical protein n=1 Tax=Labrenzia sp. CP4 TaxID=1674922 RepID=UPI000AFEE195|nr:hypothetical protein [Labrenzia sp. CP4]
MSRYYSFLSEVRSTQEEKRKELIDKFEDQIEEDIRDNYSRMIGIYSSIGFDDSFDEVAKQLLLAREREEAALKQLATAERENERKHLIARDLQAQNAKLRQKLAKAKRLNVPTVSDVVEALKKLPVLKLVTGSQKKSQ